MRYYNFVFYKFYKFFLIFGTYDAEIKAVTIFSGWITLSFMNISHLLEGLNIIDKYNPIYLVIYFLFFLMILFYNIKRFIKGKNYIQVKNDFEKNRMSSVKGTIIMMLFLLLPFVEMVCSFLPMEILYRKGN